MGTIVEDKRTYTNLKEHGEDMSHENEVTKSNEKHPNLGGKRPGAGRPPGSKTKKLWKSMDEMAEKYQHSPLDYLLSVLNNPASAPERKLFAAEKAAPYIHPKLASTTTKIGTDAPVEIRVQWEKDKN
jgi:hypothetical protein|tara:strand:+ start:644 stop:1027 length:384 start_codon:yes stop_codon:yes gene_type:complete